MTNEQPQQQCVYDNLQSVADYISDLENTIDSLTAKNISLLAHNNELTQEVTEMKSYNERVPDIVANAELITKKGLALKADLAQQKRLLEQSKAQKADLSEELKRYKEIANSPKKIREKIKGYQDKLAKSLDAVKGAKSITNKYKKERDDIEFSLKEARAKIAQAALTGMYSKDGDHLMLFPAALTMNVYGHHEKQLVLLYLNSQGRGCLIAIDEDGQPQLAADEAQALQPSESTLIKAGAFLRKAKRQKWAVTPNDLMTFKDSE